VNDSVINLFSEIKESLIGKSIWELYPENENNTLHRLAKKALKSGKTQYFDKFSQRHQYWLEVNLYPSKDGLTVTYRDITKRKVEEMEGHKVAIRNSLIIESMRDNFLLTDSDLNVIDINPAFAENSGYTRDELLKMNVTDFDPEMTLTNIKRNLKKALNKGTVLFDTKNKRKNGEIVDVEVALSEMKIDGKIYFASFGRDVSEFKTTQEELRTTNERFQLISSTTQDAVWEVDMETGSRWANETHQSLYGLNNMDEVPGSEAWVNRIHPDEREEIIKSLDTAMGMRKNIWLEEYRFKTENRGWINVYDRTYMVYDKKNTLVKMVGSMLDITDLKKAEEQIRNEKRLSDVIINSLPGIFYLYSEKNKFLKWNKNFETISGFTSEEIAGMQPLDFFDENDQIVIGDKIKEVMEKGYGEAESHLHTKSNGCIPYYFTGLRTIIEGEKCLIGTGIDLTLIKKAEKELREMEQHILEQKVEEQKKISRAIINSQEKQRNYIGRELHDNVNQILAGARLYMSMGSKQSDYARELIKYPLELLDSGITEIRALTHKHVTPLGEIDLKQLTEKIVENLLEKSNIKTKLVYEVNRYIDEDIKTNIYRILQEHINNIIKHSKCSEVLISIKECGDDICINIDDNGQGFDTKKKREGIGISNIMNRIQSFDGSFKLESSPGNGCKLKVILPRVESIQL
jgi:PAS domain S-box-containing protein